MESRSIFQRVMKKEGSKKSMDNNAKEKGIDLATNSIDTFVQKLLESEMFSGIPFVGLFASSAKFGLSLRDTFFISKIRIMIDELGVSDTNQLK